MRFAITVVSVMLLASASGMADELVYADDFEDGTLDGWHTFGAADEGYDFWISDGELWGRSSSGGDCSHHPNAHGIAMISDLFVSDVTVDITMTNRNYCGWFGLLLRVTDQTWTSWDEIGYWRVFVDPGASVLSVEYMDHSSGPCPEFGSMYDPYTVDVPHYYRVVLAGQTMQLFEKPSPEAQYELRYTAVCETGSLGGYVGVAVGQAGKHASFDDIAIYATGASPAGALRVPSQYATIQAGIDAAAHGDTVLVAPGTYDESAICQIYTDSWVSHPVVANLRPGVSLVSESGPEVTIIDGIDLETAGVYGDTLGSTTLIRGFKFVNCKGPIVLSFCGSPTVEDCIVSGCYWSGIRLRDASPFIYGNTLLECSNDGIRLHGSSYPVIAGNIIGWSGDDGIENDYPAVPTIMGNTIIHCGTTPSNPSQGIDTGGQNLVIERNIIAWNESAFWSEGGCTILWNNIYGNGGNNSFGNCISEDPLFCDFANMDLRIMEESGCAPLGNPWHVLIGAMPIGCNTSVKGMTWGSIKALYR